MDKEMKRHRTYERIAVFVFGVAFVIGLIVLAILFSEPTDFQYTVFRIVLALAAAGVAAFIPGFIEVDIKNWVRAGGAIAVFVVVYFFSPANLVTQPKAKSSKAYSDRLFASIVSSPASDQVNERGLTTQIQESSLHQALNNQKKELDRQKNLIEQQNKEILTLKIQIEDIQGQLAKIINSNLNTKSRRQQPAPHSPPPHTAPKSWCLQAASIARGHARLGMDTSGMKALLEEKNCGFWGVSIP